MKLKFLISFLILFLVTSCKEINTTNPEKAYQFWIKSNPNDKLNIIRGQYWQSSHWSLEYKLYLEISENVNWWRKFKEDNNLIIDSTEINENDFWEKPHWFNPPKKSIKYKENSEFDQGTRYFEDTLNNKIFIYEIQL